jgi:phytoene synthase
MSSGMSDNLKSCLDLLRKGDRERYLTVLFAPEEKRPALAALYAFNLETARMRDLVSEPMPGEIRLQWWRDVVSGEREGEGRQNPVGAALLTRRSKHMDCRGRRSTNLTEARIFDLYDDPMPDRATLEGYLGETASIMFQLAAQILDPAAAELSADASGHAGVAYGISGLMRLVPLHRARGQVYVPGDILAAAGTDAASWLAGEDREAMTQATEIFAALARDHLAKAEMAAGNLPKSLRPPFLPLAVARPVLAKTEKAGAAHAFEPVSLSPLRLHFAYLRRAITG